MGTEFEPRRAEPGQVITYTAPVTHEIVPEGEAVPEGTVTVKGAAIGREGAYAERDYVQRTGVQRSLTADGNGIIHPETAADVAVLESFGYPVAHSGRGVDAPAKDTPAKGDTKGSD